MALGRCNDPLLAASKSLLALGSKVISQRGILSRQQFSDCNERLIQWDDLFQAAGAASPRARAILAVLPGLGGAIVALLTALAHKARKTLHEQALASFYLCAIALHSIARSGADRRCPDAVRLTGTALRAGALLHFSRLISETSHSPWCWPLAREALRGCIMFLDIARWDDAAFAATLEAVRASGVLDAVAVVAAAPPPQQHSSARALRAGDPAVMKELSRTRRDTQDMLVELVARVAPAPPRCLPLARLLVAAQPKLHFVLCAMLLVEVDAVDGRGRCGLPRGVLPPGAGAGPLEAPQVFMLGMMRLWAGALRAGALPRPPFSRAALARVAARVSACAQRRMGAADGSAAGPSWGRVFEACADVGAALAAGREGAAAGAAAEEVGGEEAAAAPAREAAAGAAEGEAAAAREAAAGAAAEEAECAEAAAAGAAAEEAGGEEQAVPAGRQEAAGREEAAAAERTAREEEGAAAGGPAGASSDGGSGVAVWAGPKRRTGVQARRRKGRAAAAAAAAGAALGEERGAPEAGGG